MSTALVEWEHALNEEPSLKFTPTGKPSPLELPIKVYQMILESKTSFPGPMRRYKQLYLGCNCILYSGPRTYQVIIDLNHEEGVHSTENIKSNFGSEPTFPSREYT